MAKYPWAAEQSARKIPAAEAYVKQQVAIGALPKFTEDEVKKRFTELGGATIDVGNEEEEVAPLANKKMSVPTLQKLAADQGFTAEQITAAEDKDALIALINSKAD